MRLRAAWLDREPDSPFARAALVLLVPAALVYAAGAWLHRQLYVWRLRRRTRLGCRVVSVGSLLAGGTAKTPLAAWLAHALHRRGHRVALATRGFGREGRERVLVMSDGHRIHSSVSRAGDEAGLLAAHAPGVPVLVGADRALVGMRAVAAFGVDVLVLDDGFTHHRLERDLDVVAFDGPTGLGNGWRLPRGPLRSSQRSLGRADVVAVSDPPLAQAAEAAGVRRASAATRLEARRTPRLVRTLSGRRADPPEILEGRKIGMLTGIARPASFRRSLERLGAEVVAERCFADHHRYRMSDLDGLDPRPELWVTTEKDAGKILPSWLRGLDLRVLVEELVVSDERSVLDRIEAALRRRSGVRSRDAG